MAVVKCPRCGKPVEWTERSKYRPFCSERCHLIDLGAWIAEEHKVPGEPVDISEIESTPRKSDD